MCWNQFNHPTLWSSNQQPNLYLIALFTQPVSQPVLLCVGVVYVDLWCFLDFV